MMAELARGEVGLIISGHAYVSREGQAGRWQLGAYGDELSEGLAAMADAVHRAGGKIALQLAHAGNQANTKLSGLPSVGPVALAPEGQLPCRALDQDGIAAVAEAFAQAAARAKRAGFDAVQVHAAHGYLLSQFLSPAWNTRADEYGGCLENRARALLDVVRAVRMTVGPDYPVLAKLNSQDFVDNGLTVADSTAVAVLLEAASVDAVELSGGCRPAGEALMPARKGRIRSPAQEAYYREAALGMKSRLSIPLMLVGGVRSMEVARELLQKGTADYISLSRPLICEPGLVKRWREGDTRPAQCVSDNACYAPGFAGEGIRCVTMEKKRARAAGL
jgi:2,4-dienoyl-CoA reductase-like NADH-dependent reductase (Old Yellow Enzyme family)